jgi:hypothetical protein
MELIKDNQKANKETPTFKKMSVKATAVTLKLLELHCKTIGEYAVYNLGYDDNEIANLAFAICDTATENGVARIRREMYGSLGRTFSKPVDNIMRLERLERIVAKFANAAGFDISEIL